MHLAGVQIDELVQKFAVWVIPLLLGITLHEFGHAWAAWKLGDPTARNLGRVSLDPAKHIDPVGTILIPGLMILLQSPILFGWAKPVPINYRRLRNYRWGVALVAFAGPAMNLIMMFLWALLFKFIAAQYAVFPQAEFFVQVAVVGITFNAMLFVLNMLPIPPLDGGRITVELLPYKYSVSYEKIEPYGMLIVLGVLYLFNGRIFLSIFVPFNNFVLSQI
jgi:Zn-dependent protease